jgi:hypothetical protein
VQRRWDNLLAVLRTQTPTSQVVERALRERLHLFCVPMRAPAAGMPARYHGALGHQLKVNACAGILTNVALKQRLTGSPGPFLLTLPARMSASNSRTAVLFADLAPHAEDAIADLAYAYMTGLLKDFPRDQALWRPPAVQRVALTLMQVASAAGSLVQTVLPAAQAR